MDTRDCPTSDSCLIYASYSTNGGTSFVANQPVSNKKFRINCTQCNGGAPAYLGDYNSIASNPKTSMLAWTNFRNNTFGNYTAYFPDYALKVNPTSVLLIILISQHSELLFLQLNFIPMLLHLQEL